MLTKLDKGFGGVYERLLLGPKNLAVLGLKWQRNRDGVVEESAESDKEVVAVVLVSILCVCSFSCVGRLRLLKAFFFASSCVLVLCVDELRYRGVHIVGKVTHTFSFWFKFCFP